MVTNTNLATVGDMTLLGSNTSNSITDINLSDSLSNYKEIAFCFSYDDASIISPSIISVEVFKTNCTSSSKRFIQETNYGGFCYTMIWYINDTKLQCMNSLTGRTLRIYGIK